MADRVVALICLDCFLIWPPAVTLIAKNNLIVLKFANLVPSRAQKHLRLTRGGPGHFMRWGGHLNSIAWTSSATTDYKVWLPLGLRPGLVRA